MAKPGSTPPSKLPVPVTAFLRGPLGEVSASVIDVNPFGAELHSKTRLAPNERVGLTLRCPAVRGPALAISGEIRTCREEPGPMYFLQVDFTHTGDSEKRLQTFLWGLEEARRKNRHR
ncbi:MAG TPA: PilZ domain-containing protein [Planctomycetota bacterium]|nr:PilZ domain-containing protein [Planctomycetota bacterium]